ncbi:precorrin-3B synthase [Acidiphilium sp. PA]|uniref:precorrin-3B synthase n=1 Tax=Acidiphilium sp. PA TaxID=2871705 RepID=UPI002242CC1D|nr:precorrin-3B synthase [Acidiphilium sp. PA]MCW8307502.1 precorrin-3B synthase [Acidiphilium sp. PA]
MSLRGWCPSLAEPMPAADGLLVRLRPRLARLRAAEARLVADAAARHGNGAIELTSRGNLQLRGFSAASAVAAAAMIGHLDQPARRPQLLTAPLLGVDPAAHPAGEVLAAGLGAVIAALPAVSGRAEKFFITLDAGGAAGLGATGADIAITAAVPAMRDAGWVLRRDGDPHAVVCATDAVVGVVEGWLRDWLRAGVARMRAIGPGAAAAVRVGAAVPVHRIPGVAMVSVPFGAMDAARLRAIADRADPGDGVLRLTPWRVIMLAGVHADAYADAPAGAAVRACIGRRGCAAASTDTRADAAVLAAHFGADGDVHVSGCAKGCAHPMAAALTLVGRDGRYDVVVDGRAGDAPVREGLALADVVAQFGLHAGALA